MAKSILPTIPESVNDYMDMPIDDLPPDLKKYALVEVEGHVIDARKPVPASLTPTDIDLKNKPRKPTKEEMLLLRGEKRILDAAAAGWMGFTVTLRQIAAKQV